MYFLAYTSKIGFLGSFPDWESAKEACESLVTDESDSYHIEQHNDDDDLRHDW